MKNNKKRKRKRKEERKEKRKKKKKKLERPNPDFRVHPSLFPIQTSRITSRNE